MKWRDIPGFDGEYQVNNIGTVYSVKSKRVLRQKIDRYGYAQVTLYHKGHARYISVHRAVAMAFIPNPDRKNCVNHLDENKLNNDVKNLEWVTVKENDNYGTRNERMKRTKSKRPVIRILPDGTEQHYRGVKEASRKTGIAHSQIRNACLGVNKMPWAKEWRYA